MEIALKSERKSGNLWERANIDTKEPYSLIKQQIWFEAQNGSNIFGLLW